MRMLVICDTADLIEVSEEIVMNRELYRRRFRKWIEDPSIKHKYWIDQKNGTKCLLFRTDAFVEWLNKKIITKEQEKACIIATSVDEKEYADLPFTWF